jgi:hypothetical protein
MPYELCVSVVSRVCLLCLATGERSEGKAFTLRSGKGGRKRADNSISPAAHFTVVSSISLFTEGVTHTAMYNSCRQRLLCLM